MISNQILQSTIEGIKNISRVELCVTDVEGKVLVTTFPEVEISQNDIITFAQSQADSQTMKNYQFFKKRGMNVELGFDIGNNKFIPFEIFEPDLIFYSHPWYVERTQGPVVCSKFALTYYIPYFLTGSAQINALI